MTRQDYIELKEEVLHSAIPKKSQGKILDALAQRWISVEEALPEFDEEVIVCVSGKDGNITYEHAVLGGNNFYDNGKWYIDGVYRENVKIHAWMRLPDAY